MSRTNVALIDYGSGNLRSAERALVEAAARVGVSAEVRLTADPDTVRTADRVVLPGVGAFASCRAGLDAVAGLVEAMTEAVRTRGAPFLGVCVGMQLLADAGHEFGVTAGLGWVPGEVRRLEPDGDLPIPHMGWNAVEPTAGNPLLPDTTAMYFANSYAFRPSDSADAVGWTDHGGRFASAVLKDNVAGVQFHPEKSQAEGLALLGRWLEWRP